MSETLCTQTNRTPVFRLPLCSFTQQKTLNKDKAQAALKEKTTKIELEAKNVKIRLQETLLKSDEKPQPVREAKSPVPKCNESFHSYTGRASSQLNVIWSINQLTSAFFSSILCVML